MYQFRRGISVLFHFPAVRKTNDRNQILWQKYCSFKLKKMDTSKTLKDFGYTFNAAGELRKIGADGKSTEEPFQFNVSDQHAECQAHYEALGAAVTEHVYRLLETEVNLRRLPVPADSTAGNGTFIFASKDYDKKEVLLVLIHGSGAVKAGQWSRALIINENLDHGTQIPYIKRALANNYGVIVLNTNDNCTIDGKEISMNGSAEDHGCYVWDTYISSTKAKAIVIVAHSYGGLVTLKLSEKFKQQFERVKAIAFTDSVHGYANIKVANGLKEIARNWISSKETLDTPIKTPDHDIQRVSAGHPKHEMTSHSSIDSVFKFIEEKLASK